MATHKPPAVDRFKRSTARRLRMRATNAEILLWRQLKALETRGTHFRRQMPIGKFVVDFACPAARLAVEVDGSQHGEDDHRARDEERTRWLETEGYRVLRFWNNDVTQNMTGVMETIYAALYGAGAPRKLRHVRRKRIIASE